jgi:sugar phosphate isomerase/epimerase
VRTLDIEILRLKPDTRVAAYRPVLETGARLGARNVLVAGNDPTGRGCRAVRRAVRPRRAARLAMSLEPMPWTDVRTFADALSVVEAAQRDNGAVLVDAIHFDRARRYAGGARAGAAPRLRYLQLCDAPAERPRTCPVFRSRRAAPA